MNLRWNKYCLGVYNSQGGITAVLLGTDKYIKITDKNEIEQFKKYYEKNEPLDIQEKMVQQLYQNGFIVENNFNEYESARKKITDFLEEEKKELYLTLYVTNQCNFRCIYCPEEHNAKRLSGKNWKVLYKYLTKSIKEGVYKKIAISFFGGEPLLEVNKIIEFLTDLKNFCKDNPSIEFKHDITTNGYFLTPEIYDKLSYLDINYYMVTVDGFAETHDKMRRMRNNKSSWETIIRNLKYINSIDDDNRVCLRANYNSLNLNTLLNYRDWLLQTFKNKKFKFLFHPITDFSTNVDESLLADNLNEEEQKIIDNVNDFSNEHKNFALTPYLSFLGLRCNSSKYSAYTMDAEGKLAKCDNLTIPYKEAYIGSINQEGCLILNQNAHKWYEDFEIENCKTCILYPLCAGRSCPAKKVLYPDRKSDCLQNFNEVYENLVKFIKNI